MKFKEITENRVESKILDKIWNGITKLKLPYYIEYINDIKIFNMPNEDQPGYDENDDGENHDFIDIDVDDGNIELNYNDDLVDNFIYAEISDVIYTIKKIIKKWS